MLKYSVLGLIGAIVALAVYVRLAPINTDDWHSVDLPTGTAGELAAEGSFTVVRDVSDAAVLLSMDAIIMATPRTTRIAGNVASGRLTYVTRSRVMGFPDYTTVTADGGKLVIYGRLRFGRSDMGVNRVRITGWLTQLDNAAQ